jgi:hypothetical protein
LNERGASPRVPLCGTHPRPGLHDRTIPMGNL